MAVPFNAASAVGNTSLSPVAVTPVSSAAASTSLPRSGFRKSLQSLLQGVTALIPDGSTIPDVATGGFAKTEVVAELTQWLALYTAIDAQDQALAVARKQLKAALPQARVVYTELKDALVGFFKPGNPQLVQFGFKPRKPAPKPSSQQLAARALKAAKTRELRGTKSAKAKKTLRYTGPVVPAAIAAPATPEAQVAVVAVTPPKT